MGNSSYRVKTKWLMYIMLWSIFLVCFNSLVRKIFFENFHLNTPTAFEVLEKIFTVHRVFTYHIEKEERGTAMNILKASVLLLQYFCLCSFIKFRKLDNCQVMSIYWREFINENRQNLIRQETCYRLNKIILFSRLSLLSYSLMYH